MQNYKFRETTGGGLLQFPAHNHNHAAEILQRLVKELDGWKLEDFE